jgi:hypothetical protein
MHAVDGSMVQGYCMRCLRRFPLTQLYPCAACREIVCSGCMHRIDSVPARVYGYEVQVSVILCRACLLPMQR